jgi:hypothetical protein
MRTKVLNVGHASSTMSYTFPLQPRQIFGCRTRRTSPIYPPQHPPQLSYSPTTPKNGVVTRKKCRTCVSYIVLHVLHPWRNSFHIRKEVSHMT